MSASSNSKRVRSPQQALTRTKNPPSKRRPIKSRNNQYLHDIFGKFTLFSFLMFIIKALPDLFVKVWYWLRRRYNQECPSSSDSSP